jgi:hypothetical protein
LKVTTTNSVVGFENDHPLATSFKRGKPKRFSIFRRSMQADHPAHIRCCIGVAPLLSQFFTAFEYTNTNSQSFHVHKMFFFLSSYFQSLVGKSNQSSTKIPNDDGSDFVPLDLEVLQLTQAYDKLQEEVDALNEFIAQSDRESTEFFERNRKEIATMNAQLESIGASITRNDQRTLAAAVAVIAILSDAQGNVGVPRALPTSQLQKRRSQACQRRMYDLQ